MGGLKALVSNRQEIIMINKTQFGLMAAAICLLITNPALAMGKPDKPAEPATVLIDPTGNDVDATVVNEVEIKNDSGNLDVRISNGPGEPIPVVNGAAARTPYAVTVEDIGDGDNFTFMSTTVPAGHVFVIEFVAASFSDLFPTEGVYLARLNLYTGGNLVSAPMLARPQPNTAPDALYQDYVVNQSVRLYADPGSGVSIHASAAPAAAALSGSFVLSGYLVPVGDPSLAP